MTDHSPDWLIAGASARAAAFSAVRAGRTVAAADLFADRDLQAIAATTAIADWPAGVERWAETFDRSVPLIYVGGLENAPELLERIAASRPVYGVVGEPLRNIRTPEFVARQLDKWSIPRPALMSFNEASSPGNGLRGVPPGRTHAPGSSPCRWLVKPRCGSAGRGVRWSTETAALADDEYVQEFIDGRVGSAAFLASEHAVELLGVTELLLPDAARPSPLPPFAYCGSITVEVSDTEPLKRLGRCLATAGLRGLFGVDFVRRDTSCGSEFIPIEVNPRYTAGMEVLERRDNRSFIALHVAAFAGGRLTPAGVQPPRPATAHYGKRIVYAPHQCRVGLLPASSAAERRTMSFPVADIPEPGTIIPAGAPICTVFATGTSRDECFGWLRTLEVDVLSHCEPT